ncbi:Zinc knuckle [Carex littledalei]|uniref:Zinc knuckle n=1 Tax=Carex littledalei TaxID=544730 RepID=A0A833VXC8_9POAL|nr:Zinc knuckle [Carex littledalei]
MDGQDVTLKIPVPFQAGLATILDSSDQLLIGEIPVLRLVLQEEASHKSTLDIKRPQDTLAEGSSLQLKRDVQTSNDINESFNGTREIIFNLNGTRKDQNNEGWTQVKGRKSKESRFTQRKQSLLHIHAYKLRQQRKCFKCLLTGHIQAVCKNPRRCLFCNESGHIIRDCPSRHKGIPNASRQVHHAYKRKPPILPKYPPPGNTNPSGTSNLNKKESVLKPQHRNMAVPRDWLTVPMNEPVPLWQERPASLDVYIAPRAELSPANLFLERSAFIFAGPGASDPYLNRRIATVMGRHFRCDPSDFYIHLVDEDYGDRLLIFPNELMAQAAINRATFYVGNNIEITLHPYSPDLQLAFSPLGGRARIRLYGLPLQHWNRFDMCTLVSGFEYPLRIAPYFNNGNYEYLTMLVACKKASKIPFNLKLRVKPHKKKVRVEIDGWLANQGPPPPPNGGNNTGGPRGRSPHREGRARYRQSQGSMSPVNYDRRNRGAQRSPRAERMHSSSGSNRTTVQDQWLTTLRYQLEAAGAPIGESCKKYNFDKERALEENAILTKQVPDMAGFKEAAFFSEFMHYLVKEGIFSGKAEENGTNHNVTIVELDSGEDKGAGAVNNLDKGKGLAIAFEGAKQITNEQVWEGMLATDKGQSSGLSIIQEEMEYEDVMEATIEADKEEMEQELLQDAPPETTNPATGSVRRSARLRGKYPNGVRFDSGKRNYKKKSNKAKQARLEYLQSLNPLDKDQAQLVVKLAGVEIQGNIEEEVAKVAMN